MARARSGVAVGEPNSSATTGSGVSPRRSAAAGDLVDEITAGRSIEPGRADDPETLVAVIRRPCRLLAGQLAAAVRVAGRGGVILSITASVRRSPSKTSLLERSTNPAPISRQACARTPTASPFRRIAVSGSRAAPSTSVMAAVWMTSPGRSRATSAMRPVRSSRSNRGRSQPRTAPAAAVAKARPRRPRLPETTMPPSTRPRASMLTIRG